MTTIISTVGEYESSASHAVAGELWLSSEEMAKSTGWHLRPEGLCQGDTCVPIPVGGEQEFLRDNEINAARFWQHLDAPIVHSEEGDVWYLGEGAGQQNETLASLAAPNFTLPDFSGKLHSLTDFGRQRVLLITWASW